MSSLKRGASGKVKNKRDTRKQAKVKDIEYYLGEGWIDIQSNANEACKTYYRNIATSSDQPKRCPKCKMYWVNTVVDSRGTIKPRKLDSHFYNIPAEKEKCWKC